LNGSKIIGDEEKLRTVVNNILSNAVKFTPEGGTIEASLLKKDNKVYFTVIDDGIGISSKFMPYVFERFQQADSSITRRHGGLGLGLAICKHIVNLHNGSIEARSEGVGKGAEFIVKLPIKDQ
jgi:signal transduction histidine kinase